MKRSALRDVRCSPPRQQPKQAYKSDPGSGKYPVCENFTSYEIATAMAMVYGTVRRVEQSTIRKSCVVPQLKPEQEERKLSIVNRYLTGYPWAIQYRPTNKRHHVVSCFRSLTLPCLSPRISLISIHTVSHK